MDKDDQTSVYRLVEEWKNNPDYDSPIQYYKGVGVSNDDTSETIPTGKKTPYFSKTDFLIVFQSREQALMMCENSRVLLVDATHGISVYDFLLLSLLVIDRQGKGLCCAWAIASKENYVIWYLTAKNLRPVALKSRPEVLISDDTNSAWNGFTMVFIESLIHKLLCHFHILQNVRKKCGRTNLKNEEVIQSSEWGMHVMFYT